MKILFIKTTIGTYSPYFDIGIGLISAKLKEAGHQTSFFSFDNWDCLDLLKKRIADFNPDIIGFSALASTFSTICKLAEAIKKIYPNIFCFCGGIHTTLCPEDISKSKYLDGICLGEGEESFLEMVNALSKKNKEYLSTPGFWIRNKNKIIKNKKRIGLIDINTLPLPDREIFANEGLLYFPFSEGKDVYIPGQEKIRQLEFIFSRGCPFRCTYCSNHALSDFYGPKYVRLKNPIKAIKEIESVIKQYRADCLMFHDDLFTLNKTWLISFLKHYRKKINLPFKCNIRIGTCDKEILLNLKKSKCMEIKIGLESGNEKIRETVLKRKMTNEQIKKTFSMAKKIGLKTFAYIMIGFPGETPYTFKDTIELVADINPYSYDLSVFHPYKGTSLYKLCKKNGYLVKKQKPPLIERQDTILKLPKFKRSDILYFLNNFELLVFYKRKSTQKNISGLHHRFLYFLYKESPSSIWFGIKQAIYRLDRSLIAIKLAIMYLLGLRKKLF